MGAEDPAASLLGALDALVPKRGPGKTTCAYLSSADPGVLDRIRDARRRGNSPTRIAQTLRANGATVTLDGIREHFNSECATCRISLKP